MLGAVAGVETRTLSSTLSEDTYEPRSLPRRDCWKRTFAWLDRVLAPRPQRREIAALLPQGTYEPTRYLMNRFARST